MDAGMVPENIFSDKDNVSNVCNADTESGIGPII